MKEFLKDLDKFMMIVCFGSAVIMFVLFPFYIAMMLGWFPVLALVNIMAKNKLEDEVDNIKKKLKYADEQNLKREQLINRLQNEIAEQTGELTKLLKQKKTESTRRKKIVDAESKPKVRAKKAKPMTFKEACDRSLGGNQTFK